MCSHNERVLIDTMIHIELIIVWSPWFSQQVVLEYSQSTLTFGAAFSTSGLGLAWVAKVFRLPPVTYSHHDVITNDVTKYLQHH